jgi:putative membrane protein insertion efficiency factor
MSLAAIVLRALVRLYQLTLSGLFPPACRFEPSCSHYAMEALRQHGALRGTVLTVRRVLRCNPWGGMGDDPVPGPRRPVALRDATHASSVLRF